MAKRDYDDGWPWDPKRPVAGQYAEWVSERFDAECARMRAAMLDAVTLDGSADPNAIAAVAIATLDAAAVNPAIAGCPSNECQIRNKCTRVACLSRAALTAAAAADYEAWRAAEPDLRDEDDDPPGFCLPTLISCSAACGAATSAEAALVMGWSLVDGQWWCLDCRRVKPTAENCKLLGAKTCEHGHMTAEETEAQFGDRGAKP